MSDQTLNTQHHDDTQTDVRMQCAGVTLDGMLNVPNNATGLVIFAHGSGSSRHSPRNQHVAKSLRQHGLGTLLFDLLTHQEEVSERHTRHLRFDIELLTARLAGAIDWVRAKRAHDENDGDVDPDNAEDAGIAENVASLPIGLFGASTGAAAALRAAAQRSEHVDAVVSRGGRPDLAGDALPQVKAPTLLIVGSLDEAVIAINREAAGHLTCEHAVEIVEGASHLFEEEGTLDEAARLACEWFADKLTDNE